MKEQACKSYTISGTDGKFLTLGEMPDRLHLLVGICGKEGPSCSMEIDYAAWEFILSMKYSDSDKLEVNRGEEKTE
ncbi:MAG: hypothetical protein U1E51_27315 [Candidatus Binatia bacterium]|nr:hypothetical protein [Candidatus Binatia bacterium]